LRNENLKFDRSMVDLPSVYQDAQVMVDNKLRQETKENYPQVLKAHATQKMQLITYFTSLGSLKTLRLIHDETTRGDKFEERKSATPSNAVSASKVSTRENPTKTATG